MAWGPVPPGGDGGKARKLDGETAMRIKRIDLIHVSIPYDPPVGPYCGGGGRRGAVTTGASSLLAKIVTDTGTVGWGEGKGPFEADPNPVLAGHHLADIEGALAAMKQAGIRAGPRHGAAPVPAAGRRYPRGGRLLRLHGAQASFRVRRYRPRIRYTLGLP